MATQTTPGSVKVTGVKVSYYFICHTKLWLFSHNIELEDDSENVRIGRTVHEDRYKRARKGVSIDGVMKADFVRKGDELVVHEVKKSRKMEDSHRYQLLFYLKYLKDHGVEATGELNYPLLNKRERVELTPEDEDEIDRIEEEIREIVLGEMPEPERKKICGKCAYAGFCWGDSGS